MGIEIESAGLAALRRNSAQEAQIQEAFFEFDRLLKLGEPTGKADFAFHRAIASATNNPFYVEILDALGDRTIPCDRSSPWYTVEVLSIEYLTGLQREHLLVPQRHLRWRSARRARRHACASDRRAEPLPHAADQPAGRISRRRRQGRLRITPA